MQIQPFVTKVIEAIGGVVMPVEYALSQVLIPDAYVSYFQNKNEVTLAFDFEVALEHPDAEFVTFGSYIFEQIVAITHQEAKSTLRFADVERLELGNPEKKIRQFLDEPGTITIAEEKPVQGVWAVFQFTIAHLTDEKSQGSEQVWVNLLTNEIDTDMKAKQTHIIYQQTPVYAHPIPKVIDTPSAFEKAVAYVEKIAEEQRKNPSREAFLQKDVDRITTYYSELLAENQKRAQRKGLSEEKQTELTAKSDAIKLEKKKQLEEIYQKYNGQVEIDVDNGMFYFVPLLAYTVNVTFRAHIYEKVVYYNPITKSFFEETLEAEEAVQTGSV